MARKRLKFNEDLARFTPRQLEAVAALGSGLIKYLLYGGALGGGKSYFIRWYCVRRLIELAKLGFPYATAMLACEDYPSLKDRQLSKIASEFPPWLGVLREDHKVYGRCFIITEQMGGGVICFRNLDDPSKYQSAEFALIAIDELTKNVYDVFTFLRTRLRWPGLEDILCQFVAGTNPGGIGHGWVKQLWMSKVFPEEWIKPIDRRGQFAYIPSKATDNPHLTASYWSMLDTLPEALRKPFRDGNWDVFVGQAFPEFTQEAHVLPDDTPIPDGAPIYMTYDWGFGKPFSIGWWWVDGDGRVYRFYEWYGWDGTPDQGLRMTDSDIAEGIKSREKARSLNSEMLIRLAGPDCFQKRPDYKGGGQGPPTSEVFAGKGLYLGVGDPSRELKIRAFRERLRIRPEDGKPMLYVYKKCRQFIRTIPDLVMDQSNIEDVDTTGEDHVYDEVCHICMARPITLVEKPPDKQTRAQKDFDHVEGKDENLRAVNID